MPLSYARYDNDKSLSAVEEFSRVVLDPRGQGEGDRLRTMIEKASVECQKGVAVSTDMVVAVGMTPSAGVSR